MLLDSLTNFESVEQSAAALLRILSTPSDYYSFAGLAIDDYRVDRGEWMKQKRG